MSILFSLLLITTGCGSDKGGNDDTGVHSDGIELNIQSPDRGIFQPEGNVTLEGSVTSYGSELIRLTVNDDVVTVSDVGNFTAMPPLRTGLNIFDFEATNTAGYTAVDARAIYYGAQIQQSDTVESGAMILVTPELLDDDEESLNDAAAILEAAVDDPAVGDLIVGQSIPTDYFDFTLTGFTIDSADIDLRPDTGAIIGEVTLEGIWISFELEDILGIGLDSSGEAWTTKTEVDMTLEFEMQNGAIVNNSSNSDASMTGFGLTVEWVPDSIEGYLGDWLASYVEETIEEQLNTKAGGLLADFLEGLTSGTEVAGVTLDMALSSIEIAPQGIRMTADVGAGGTPVLPMPQNGGSPSTVGASPSWDELPDDPISLVLDDDIVNQLMFGFWLGGSFEDYEFSGAEFDLLAGGPVYEPLGPVESVALDFSLPLMLAPATNSDMTANFGVGELIMSFLRTDGSQHDISVNAWLGAEVSLTESSSVDIDLDDNPENLRSAVGVVYTTSGEEHYEVAAQLETILPGLLGRAATLAPNIDIPSLALGEKLGLESMEGLVLGLTNADVTVLDSGWTILSSSFEAQEE